MGAEAGASSVSSIAQVMVVLIQASSLLEPHAAPTSFWVLLWFCCHDDGQSQIPKTPQAFWSEDSLATMDTHPLITKLRLPFRKWSTGRTFSFFKRQPPPALLGECRTRYRLSVVRLHRPSPSPLPVFHILASLPLHLGSLAARRCLMSGSMDDPVPRVPRANKVTSGVWQALSV